MAKHQFDLTELYISNALEEQIERIFPGHPQLIDISLRQQIVELILQAIPDDRRIFQTVETFPKQVSVLLSAEHQQYFSDLVEQFLQEMIVLPKKS